MSKVNFYNDEGSQVGAEATQIAAKKRPQSSKPPKFVTTYSGTHYNNMDWDSEYDYQMKVKTVNQKDEIFNILDN